MERLTVKGQSAHLPERCAFNVRVVVVIVQNQNTFLKHTHTHMFTRYSLCSYCATNYALILIQHGGSQSLYLIR